MVTREQALSCGVSPSGLHRRRARGTWIQVLPRVYSLSQGPLTWEARAVAVSLWAGPPAAVSHATAAAAWEMEGFSRTAPVVVTTTRSLKVPAPWVRVHRARSLPASDFGRLDAVVVTSPPRTLLDLAARHPADKVGAALDDALARRLVSIPRLRWYVQARRGKRPPGAKTLERLLIDRYNDGPAVESALERKVWALLTGSDLPRPVRQHPVYDQRALVARVDFAYPEEAVAIEVDGYRWHSGRAAWSRDLVRRNRLTSVGWRVIHVTHSDLLEPERVVDQVRRLLANGRSCP